MLQIIDQAREHFTIAGLVLASYDPSCDTNGTIASAAARIVRELTSVDGV